MIDRALEQKPADFDAVLKPYRNGLGSIPARESNPLKAPGWKNVARMDDKLGAGENIQNSVEATVWTGR